MMHHHELVCHTKSLVCNLHGQAHSEGPYNQCVAPLYCLNHSSFANKTSLVGHHHKLNCLLLVREDFIAFKCYQGQGSVTEHVQTSK